MRELWKTTTVEALVERGVIARPMDGNHGSIHPKTIDFVDAGIPFVMASDLENGRINLQSCAFLAEDQARSLKKGFSVEGDVLLTHKATIGRTAIVPKIEYPFIMLTPQVTYYRVLDGNVLSNQFLKLYFESKSFLDILNSWAGSGSTRPYIGITDQRNLPIILPPIVEQLEVVRLIKPIDDKIELNRRMNETLESIVQAIFRDWFIDFGPIRRKLGGATSPVEIMGGATTDPARAAELARLFPDALNTEGLPEEWPSESLSTQFEIIGGGTPKTSVTEYWDGPIPWFSVVDTPLGSDTFVFDTEKSISEAGLSNSSARLVPMGTTIISARGTVGNLAIAAQDMTFNQSCYALRSARGEHPHFAYLTAARAVAQLRNMAHGSVFSTITRQTFDALTFPSPPPELLSAIEVTLAPFFSRLKASVHESRTLAETRDFLLPRLMSGEVGAPAGQPGIEKAF